MNSTGTMNIKGTLFGLSKMLGKIRYKGLLIKGTVATVLQEIIAMYE